ncbi:MAG TPA: hypothetical protein VD757_01770 [Candidatus Nitrosocosmicus sp.]|nr:hypothetical protein [Candidatus Nitrosocosmicus sp.]
MEENYYALMVCIIKNCSPEQAFRYLENGKKGRSGKAETQQLIAEIKRLKDQGKTYREIGAMYNMTAGNIYRRLKGARDKEKAM